MVSHPGIIDLDYRLGGFPRHYFRFDERPLMQVPDEVRKCVAFLAYKQRGSYHLAGTAFFVGTPILNAPEKGFVYAVTAKHVIDGICENSDDQRVYFRLNFKDSDAKLVDVGIEEWFFHPNDPAVDVAVLQVVLEDIDYRAYPLPSFATDAVIAEESVGVGEEVFLTGLFVHHAGRKRNVPILRVGNIAAMPEEPVNTENGSMEAYLIETRSIGGLSGSPVFVHLGMIRHRGGQTMIAEKPEGVFFLLGLMHGHWDLPAFENDIVVLDQNYTRSVNMGIGIVVPAKKILEVINQAKLKDVRDQMEREWKQEGAAVMDTAIAEDGEESPFTKQDFEDALKKVSRVEEMNEDQS